MSGVEWCGVSLSSSVIIIIFTTSEEGMSHTSTTHGRLAEWSTEGI